MSEQNQSQPQPQPPAPENNKVSKRTTPPKRVQNMEHFQRLNYLYQISMFNTIFTEPNGTNPLSRGYIRNLDLISKKVKGALLPNMKRTICKKCHRLLIPTKTASYQIENTSRRDRSPEKRQKSDEFVIKCVCGEKKTFKIGVNRRYRTYYEKEGNLMDV